MYFTIRAVTDTVMQTVSLSIEFDYYQLHKPSLYDPQGPVALHEEHIHHGSAVTLTYEYLLNGADAPIKHFLKTAYYNAHEGVNGQDDTHDIPGIWWREMLTITENLLSDLGPAIDLTGPEGPVTSLQYGKGKGMPSTGVAVPATSGDPIPSLNKACPGLDAHVSYPKGTGREGTKASVSKVVQYLNDNQRWPPAAIADWLESLDVDLTIKEET